MICKKRVRILLLSMLLTACCSGCELSDTNDSQKEEESVSQTDTTQKTLPNFEWLTLSAENHPELDFTLSTDGQSSIRDFCFTQDGTILLLADSIFEYDFSGNLVGTYDLQLDEHGYQAFHITVGSDGSIYLADEANHKVIKATREGISHVCSIASSDTAQWNTIVCTDTDQLTVSYFDKDGDNTWRTVILDVSGDTSVEITSWNGKIFGENLSYLPVFVSDDERTSISNRIDVQIYLDGKLDNILSIRSALAEDSSIYGLEFYGKIGGSYFGRIYEFVPNENQISGVDSMISFIRINPFSCLAQVGNTTLDGDEVIHFYNNGTYFMEITEKGLTITSLEEACNNWRAADQYQIERAPAPSEK